MQRREFCEAAASVLSTTGMGDGTTTITIKLHQSQSVTDSTPHDDSFYGARVLKEYLDVNYSAYFDDYNTNVEIVRESVDMSNVAATDIFNVWNKRVAESNHDCELLIHDEFGGNASGMGECVSCVDGDRRVNVDASYSNAAVMSYGQFLSAGDETVQLWGSAYNFATTAIMIGIHEVGHCLGLSHDLGYAYYVDGFNFDDGDVLSTPMLGSYVHRLPSNQDDSHYGRERFQADRDETYYQLILGQDTIEYVREYGFNMDW